MLFREFFKSGMQGKEPRPWQIRFAEDPWPETRVIPTGFGKTAGVLAAWIWKVARKDAGTPCRLVYCLPMRTLVEQTENAAQTWLDAAERNLNLDIELSVLMGGRSDGKRGLPNWIRNPERPAILIGTQDILISSVLMRGYGISRYRWPVDFALLNNDVFWVFDEVQLTGAALATSAQLEGFRRKLEAGRRCQTLWMSATLDPAWLKTADFTPADKYRSNDLSADDLAESWQLWQARKSLQHLEISSGDLSRKTEKAYAAELAKHAIGIAKPRTNTIVFLNTVRRAQAVFDALKNAKLEVILVHSRFRKADRDLRMKQLSEPPQVSGRIVVATQALEAGVDVSSTTMITEIAPWSSLVQRFGRCNRYGECGEAGANIFWVDLPDSETEASPYTLDELESAREILLKGSSAREPLSACGPDDLVEIPPSAPPRGAVIRRRDLFDLFDTDPDLSGFDVDVSLYVRDADDTDVRLFWRPVDEKAGPPDGASAPAPEELCPAPIGGAKELLRRKDVRAWRWDALAKQWKSTHESEAFPGMTLWIDAKCGGYDAEKGFHPESKSPVTPLADSLLKGEDEAYDNDKDSDATVRVSLARHTAHVRDQAMALAEVLHLGSVERDLIAEAALWHDLGKAHEAFVALTAAALTGGVKPPLAKWPTIKGENRPSSPRKYFRHELASALGYLANRQCDNEASLAAYVIAAHHGKVRMRIRALPNERPAEAGKLFARGVVDGDPLPETILDGITVPATTLDLDIMQLGEGHCGPSWQARTQALLKQYGPFRLAWLEALLRIADWRASAAEEEAGHDDL